ncbi:MAG: 2,3-bisphosphoglycerate-independent phosphoglycerate mutase [Candidatus Sungbacteria bacterium]|nr:2,3-bisphosphoglycerate-independent phosphoglycerate mutase [Candidatus Sungbacteria bacterium]
MSRPKPLILIILDGFGVSLETSGNPVASAEIPHLQFLDQWFPFTTLQASGVAVGLPWGEPGNSEVGHLTIGAGRVIYHHLPRIISAIYDGTFEKNEAFLKAIAHARKNNGVVHLAGLISSGSAHSYIDHLYALLNLTQAREVQVCIHAFSDGKDAPPNEGAKFYAMLEERIAKSWPHAELASVIGRFYAMDREGNEDRTKVAYELLADKKGTEVESVSAHLQDSYNRGIMDEFIEPAYIKSKAGEKNLVKKGDALIFFNFREDSMRQLTRAFVEENFQDFPRAPIENLFTVTMTEYQKGIKAVTAFPPLDINWPLARVLSEEKLTHLHIAETEKYAHVTYFLNGGIETPFEGEERALIPSVQAAHFDEVPEMRAKEVASTIVEKFNTHDVIIANFANADMVGHSGNYQSAIRAVETLDGILGELTDLILNNPESVLLITGDHGNIELKRSVMTGEKITEHSLNPVPFYLVGSAFKRQTPRSPEKIAEKKAEIGGILTDIAPTIIDLLELKKPHEMTGDSLLKNLLTEG